MNESLSKALKIKEKLLDELSKVEQFIRLHNELFGEGDDVAEPNHGRQSEDESDSPKRRRGRPSEIADAAWKVIKELNRPVQRGELVERIEAMGIDVSSDDKPRYIGTILWREKDRFENIEGRGYWAVSLGDPPSPEDSSPDIFR
ncbi:hypothetical protein Snov_2656 [Ancylobacter novellus DSM 506]|uniref:HTH HARE-type domain-containing protein n=1 Tax=Ancylobacter novellus (strain ATCC 8093 / DSM 506 / JCM 20403 / CCM 1077 / IAM 12100 / NBRC 12443 / NCIMB 10456) TaxID=639283 RepID=D7A562_ANCN5|nr:hypothetical protein [Ancylobacter novellus]ADH89950.1 hypothetical protein Snov_2656 [Ancylobacter novellus DSM 506]